MFSGIIPFPVTVFEFNELGVALFNVSWVNLKNFAVPLPPAKWCYHSFTNGPVFEDIGFLPVFGGTKNIEFFAGFGITVYIKWTHKNFYNSKQK